MRYADLTRNTKDPLKRLAHGKRFAQAAAIVPLNAEQKILDYGCGDGGFFDELSKFVPLENLYGYEPHLLDQMEFLGATTYEDREILIANESDSFDVVFCMEVCEHLDSTRLYELFDAVRSVSRKNAVIVFGVPLETGLSGFIKNTYRTFKGGVQNATLGRALKSLLSIPIPRAISPRGWIGSHVGFDALAFSETLKYGGFRIVEKHYLPLRALGPLANNEVYFVCELSEPA